MEGGPETGRPFFLRAASHRLGLHVTRDGRNVEVGAAHVYLARLACFAAHKDRFRP